MTDTPKIALVTGASRGLGYNLALALGAAGWQVVAVGRTTGGLEELDDAIRAAGGPAAMLAPMDICIEEAMAQLCRAVYDRWGHAGLWLHPAVHAAPLSPADHVDAKDMEKSIATNIRATGHLIQMVAPLLAAAPERATAMFFDDPRAGEKFFGAYGATKAAQIALARSWQAEAARIGPRVLIETPAPMATATRARFFPGEDRSQLASPAEEAARLVALIRG